MEALFVLLIVSGVFFLSVCIADLLPDRWFHSHDDEDWEDW